MRQCNIRRPDHPVLRSIGVAGQMTVLVAFGVRTVILRLLASGIHLRYGTRLEVLGTVRRLNLI
jgi:hypothetical protein